ncbi:heme/hemin ABC transporter substrate-binding protein [Ignatzschineria cameli]|uniref:Fe/B12 periplasmic-binding domain-containing protein n=1 Tax=Ignatzschineria cameli TaxID=2182793 RepID=A0A2U2ARV4_9GAMM|nr:ABC transporter substrate-binding protein [Ignatzschineria cameli]PWD86728.1 hypothetical protein DC080_03605 [Ignatzschineria cameli]PWD86919.1 hypothetical protein DC077_03655 [Ignatzschineria cameli]PWD91891.1 hypothetical protein DC079_00590 [Ignatzschineria cameli]PWD93522.1 hypothetical protein DC081_01595 [Ignatzschineria cameli]PWD94264.1 hypothetical protein DC078_01595 [Ignatzschineria cameli]
MFRKLLITTLFTALSAQAIAADVIASRIVSAANPLTQIITALGAEATLVGIDQTSHTSPSLNKIPDIGYRIALSSEGILALKPDLVLLAFDSGPQTVLEQIKQSGVEMIQFPELVDVDHIQDAISTIAAKTGREKSGIALSKKVADDAQRLQLMSEQQPPLNGFFILQEAQLGSPQISGAHTSADKLLNLLNIKNLFANDFNNYRAVSLENQLKKRPDIVLIGHRGHFGTAAQEKGEPIPPFQRRSSGMENWPEALQPKCVFEVNMSHYLVYGIHIFSEGEALLTAINACLQEQ